MTDLTAAAYPALGGDAARKARLEFCERIQSDSGKDAIESLQIPIRSGRAWQVPAGHTCRITAAEGPQVGPRAAWLVVSAPVSSWRWPAPDFYINSDISQ